MAYIITRDGEPVPGERFETENEAYRRLLRIQNQSTHWAMTYEGWGIEQVTDAPQQN